MDREREPGPTYALEDVGFVDFESRAKAAGADLRQVGSYRYAFCADAIMLAFAIGSAEPQVVAVERFDGPLRWDSLPSEIHAHHARVVAGQGIWGSWSTFDRVIWNKSTRGFPPLEPHHVIDIMAQATTAGFAPDLATASRQAGGERKLESGKNLIKLFCLPESTATPQSHPLDWAEFIYYAKFDIFSMRDVFLCSRQLPRAEWEEFWTSERINARGIAVDLKMVRHAATLVEEDARRSCDELARLTGGHVKTVNEVAKISSWLRKSLPPKGRDILTKRMEETDVETGVVTKPAKYSLTRARVEKLIAFCASDPGYELQQRVLEIRLYGGGKSSAKFAKILQQHINGTMFGMFVFNGAPQTGRYSSKGPQFQNITRKALKYEYEAVEALLRGCSYDELAALGDDSPVARKLALLVRPAFIAPEGKSFVWSDWSQIEARILPWLAGDDAGARERLQIFRECDANPKLPDLYKRSAAAMLKLPVALVSPEQRQSGKISELALGYGGSVGALQSMAANYGIYFSDEEARKTVDAWREANGWAVNFWNSLQDAVELSIGYPGVFHRAGRSRVNYICLDGSLLCMLPSGRVLTYRNIKYDKVEDLDDDDQPLGTFSKVLRCSRGHSRVKLWRGIFAENATQACAADMMRGTLRRLVDEGFDVVGHIHDEVIVQCDEAEVKATKAALHEVMLRGFGWSEGLPLMAKETAATYYTKTLD